MQTLIVDDSFDSIITLFAIGIYGCNVVYELIIIEIFRD